MTGLDISAAIEAVAPLTLQEAYDNSGWQLGDPAITTGAALVCVDLTEAVVAEAVERGCNVVVSHHPLLFRGLKQLTGADSVQRTAIAALRAGLAVYAAHTSLDNAPAPYGVSHRMAAMMGLTEVTVLSPLSGQPDCGAGVTGCLPEPVDARIFGLMASRLYGTAAARMSRPSNPGRMIRRVALCGGSGSSLVSRAIAIGADAFVSADFTYHTMLDNADSILMVDCGHRETEDCTKQLLADIISEKLPNFAVLLAESDRNPVVAADTDIR